MTTLRSLLTLTVLVCVGAIAAPGAHAAVTDSEEFAQFGSEGAGAGQLFLPQGMASDPTSGDLYVVDPGNRRIDEFTAWGVFVKAWGWGVADGVSEEPQTCTATCHKGLAGAGKGQFGEESPSSVAVGADRDVYVRDNANRRIEVFDPAGQFVSMFGGGVNKTTGGNICPVAPGDECQAGSAGTGPGEFNTGFGLAIGQAGSVLAGDEGRIEEFEADGAFKAQFATPGIVDGIAADPTGADIYAIYRGQDDIHKLDSVGAELATLAVREPPLGAIATDPVNGDLYAIQQSTPAPEEGPQKVVEFDAGGTPLPSCCVPAPVPADKAGNPGERFSLTGLGTNGAGDLYVANRSSSAGAGNYITVLGPPPLKYGPPPKVAPEITDQLLVEAGPTTATLKAKINPNFWADTRFYLEYGPAPCDSNPCAAQPAAPGAELGAGAVKRPVTSGGIELSGLAPATTYHYRFVSQSGGGPVFGPDRSFTTLAVPGPQPPCANDGFRIGFAAQLPDCRAFEMVSPVDKSNGDIRALTDITGYETALDQSALDGEALTYSSYRAFGGPLGGPFTSQYLARRGSEGWTSEPLGGPLVSNFYNTAILDDEFKAFSADLCEAWLVPNGEPTLAPGAVAGFPNLYRRGNCPKSYEALSTTPPPDLVPKRYVPELQGHSADGSRAIFRVTDNLTADSPPQPAACEQEGGEGAHCQTRLYEASGGALSYVCVFPAGTSAKAEAEVPNCSAGTSGPEVNETALNRQASVAHAISEDGTRIYWSASSEPRSPGRIYLRVNGSETLPVSETQTTKAARFWGASPDGSKALFEVEDQDTKNPTAKNKNLYLYDLASESSTLIAAKVTAVAAMSEDLSRVYFISQEAIGGANGEGKSPTAGKENLYLDAEGAIAFIATLSAEDAISHRLPSDGGQEPIYHVARATPDGGRLAFISTAELNGFDNRDAESGEPDSEVYSYEAASEKLSCASCGPAGARPQGRLIAGQSSAQTLWTAASIPAGETQLYQPRALADGGSKLFFTSYTPLLPADTNNRADVYEWEAPGASASCTGEGDSHFYPVDGGCLFLISTGRSGQDSELVDSDPSGRDVFFSTGESLVPQDPSLIDIYDAREGGGFAPPPSPPSPCQGEACQAASAAPAPPPTPRSTGAGAGNQKPKPCPKGKRRVSRKGKSRCVAKAPKRSHKAGQKHGKGKHKSGGKK